MNPIDTSDKPRIAVWGLGRIGRRHATNVLRSMHGCLAAVGDIVPDLSKDVASSLGSPHFIDLDEMLLAARPEGLVIATHASNHADAIKTAARHGVHVFCEKPLALDGPSAVAAVEAAGAAGIQLQMGFQMRFDRDLSNLAGQVRSGALGRIFQLRGTVRDAVSPSRDYLSQSGGYYRDTTPHCIDFGRWLLGEIDEVLAFGVAVSDPMYEELGDVDNATVVLKYEVGALGTVNLSRVDGYGFDTAVEVLGELGAIRVPGGRADGLEYWQKDRVGWIHVADFLERFDLAYAAELEDFARFLSENTTSSAATGVDGLASMRVAEAAAISHQRRAAVKVAEVPW